MNPIKFADLFCGIGGFRLGIERAAQKIGLQVECVFSSEIEKNARLIYEKNFHTTPSGDISTIQADDIPDMDILCGGFPCQSFSIAGKREGFNDTRGTLFFEIARIARDKRPKILFLENVKGLLNHDRGRTFGTILYTLDELGYDVEWQVLNSKDFGVPQNRERVYIIGHLRGERTGQVFPIRGTTESTVRENISTCLDANYWKGIDNHGARTHIIQHYCGDHQQDRVLDPDGISSCLPTGTGGDLIPKILTPKLEYIGALNKDKKWLDNGKELSRNYPQGNRVYSAEGIATTLSSQAGGIGGKTGLYQVQDKRIRKLTPMECERLQSFPDSWTEGIADSNRYKCLGNAVTVNVIEAIATKLLKGMI